MFDNNFTLPEMSESDYKEYYEKYTKITKISNRFNTDSSIDKGYPRFRYIKFRKISFRTINQIILRFEDDFLRAVIDSNDRFSSGKFNAYIDNFKGKRNLINLLF